MMTDDLVTASPRKIPSAMDRFSYIGAHAAVVRTSAPESSRRQWLDASANDDIAHVLAGIDAAEKDLFALLTLALSIGFALCAIFLWPGLIPTH
jgi:hypothetical protein